MDAIEEKYPVYNYIGSLNDIEKMTDYILKLYPNITRGNAKVAASKMANKGVTKEQLLSGDLDRTIYTYIDELNVIVKHISDVFNVKEFEALDMMNTIFKHYYIDSLDIPLGNIIKIIENDFNISRMDDLISNNVSTTGEKKYVPLETRKKTVPLNLVLAIIGSICIVGTAIYSYKNAKVMSKSNEMSLDLANVAGLDSEMGSITKQSKSSKIGSYDGYDYKKIGYDIVEGVKKDHSLLEYYLFDVYRNINKEQKNNVPLALMERIYREIKNIVNNSEELRDISYRLANSETFLEYLYNSAFISHTDKDYKELLNDIYKYKILILSGDNDPLNSEDLPESSKIRIQKLLNAFLSHKYNSMLQDEYGEMLDNYVEDNLGGRSQ